MVNAKSQYRHVVVRFGSDTITLFTFILHSAIASIAEGTTISRQVSLSLITAVKCKCLHFVVLQIALGWAELVIGSEITFAVVAKKIYTIMTVHLIANPIEICFLKSFLSIMVLSIFLR